MNVTNSGYELMTIIFIHFQLVNVLAWMENKIKTNELKALKEALHKINTGSVVQWNMKSIFLKKLNALSTISTFF